MKKTIRGVSLLVPASLLSLLMGCVAPVDEIDPIDLTDTEEATGESADALASCGAAGGIGCGAGWSDWAAIPGISGVLAPPSVAYWGGTPYMAYLGAGNQCFLTSYVGSAWAAPTVIPGCGGTVSPSLAVFNNALYAGFAGAAGGCFLSSLNNWGWANPYSISGCGGGIAPVIAPFASSLALAYALPSQAVYFTTCGGLGGCGAPILVPGVATAFPMALGVHGGALTLAYTGLGNQLFYANYGCGAGIGGGCSWGSPLSVAGAFAKGGPSLGWHESTMILGFPSLFGGGFGYAPYLGAGFGSVGLLRSPQAGLPGSFGYWGGPLGWGFGLARGGQLWGAYRTAW